MESLLSQEGDDTMNKTKERNLILSFILLEKWNSTLGCTDFEISALSDYWNIQEKNAHDKILSLLEWVNNQVYLRYLSMTIPFSTTF